jgi:hypothetical protein
MRHLARRAAWTLAALLGAGFPSLRAEFIVRLKTSSADLPIRAEYQGDRIMLDFQEVAEGLGSPAVVKDGEYLIQHASGTTVVNPQGLYYRVQVGKEKRWRAEGLDGAPYFSGPSFMVSMADIPRLFARRFLYHVQRRELSEAPSDPAAVSGRDRKVAVRHARKGQKDWISVEDAARALGVVVYASQSGQYTLVMPDFTFLELKVGESWVNKKRQLYKILPDPLLSVSGIPYATPASLSALLDADVRWNGADQTLTVPRFYGRLADLGAESLDTPLRLIGYLPQPLRMTVDELSTYYQSPGPTYAAFPSDLYESVRDFLTDRPVDPHTSGFEQWSGETHLELSGSLLAQPVTGGVRMEKVGTRARVSSGLLEWGFPRLKVQAGRDFMRIADLSAQLEEVDQVSVSHSNDHFAEGRANPEWQLTAQAGRSNFFIFVSTNANLLSAAAKYEQTFVSGGVDAFWRSAGAQRAGLSVTHHDFKNRVREVTSELLEYDETLDEFLINTDPAVSQELLSSVLTEKHGLTLAEASYGVENLLELNAVGALSSHASEPPGGKPSDTSWKLGATLGGARRRLAVSHERTGPRFRSLGDPLAYQDRRITRFTPFFEILGPWKVHGDFRKEAYGAEGRADLEPFRSDTLYVGNTLSFRRFSARLVGNRSNHTLNGKRWAVNLDNTVYFGRDSLEVGGGWSTNWLGRRLDSVFEPGTLFKQSYSGRLGYQVLRPDWKLSVSEELIRNHHPRFAYNAFGEPFRNGAHDRWETDTQLLGQRKSWEVMLQYGSKPRVYYRPDHLYTGTLRLGWQPNDRKIVNVFYAATSVRRGLADPEVWRVGLEFTNDFY